MTNANTSGEPPVQKPQFIHDCERCCQFLGSFDAKDGPADLYFCQNDILPTLVARYSDEGSDYVSGLAFVGIHDGITEANRLAVEQGLLPPDE